MDNHTIPAAAVEAAAKAYINTSRSIGIADIRAMLEAAAPYMLAEAWEEGASDGQWNAEHIYQIDAGSRHAIPNPYKEEQ